MIIKEQISYFFIAHIYNKVHWTNQLQFISSYISITPWCVFLLSLNVCVCVCVCVGGGVVWGSPVVDTRGGWAPTDPHSHVISLHKGLVKCVIPHASSPFDSVGQLWANGYYAPYKRGAVQLSVLRPPLCTAKLGSTAPQTHMQHKHCLITCVIRSNPAVPPVSKILQRKGI